MALRLPDRWMWDFWFACDGDDVHVFYLQAPRSLGDPELRHRNATIGHAVSRDLRHWEILPDALGAGPPGGFDDLATWTGSVIRHDGRWLLFYTGISHGEDLQRIGWAQSADLVGWERRGVLSQADPRFYERAHWRDPWVAWDADARLWRMLVCARAREGDPDRRGVIGHACSPDLERWTVGLPVSAPGAFHEMEVPQLVRLGGAWRVLFCARTELAWGTHYVTGAARFGPYVLDRDEFMAGDREGSHYAGRVLEHGGEQHFFAWRMNGPDGFVGELSDPMPIALGDDGSPSVTLPG